MAPKNNKKGAKKKGTGRGSLRSRLGRITLGDVGEAIGGAWDGIGRVTGFNQEIKRFDVESGVGAITNAGAIVPLSLVAEGNDFNQRDGHSIKALSLEARMTAQASAAAVQNAFRFILFLDLEQQGVVPTTVQVLEAAAAALDAPLAPFQHDNTERFVILEDWFDIVNAGGPASKARVARLPLGSHVRFQGATGVIANAREGHLFALLIGDQAVNGPALNLWTRMAYVDN